MFLCECVSLCRMHAAPPNKIFAQALSTFESAGREFDPSQNPTGKFMNFELFSILFDP